MVAGDWSWVTIGGSGIGFRSGPVGIRKHNDGHDLMCSNAARVSTANAQDAPWSRVETVQWVTQEIVDWRVSRSKVCQRVEELEAWNAPRLRGAA